jgi:hypothetical protein
MGRSSSLFDRLVRAREALARARARGADPWQLAELQAKLDQLTEAAAGAPAPELALAEYPAPHQPAEPIPLAWTDESGRPRRGPRGQS